VRITHKTNNNKWKQNKTEEEEKIIFSVYDIISPPKKIKEKKANELKARRQRMFEMR
jgi:hypothetical protein